jgi:hypothetical protein
MRIPNPALIGVVVCLIGLPLQRAFGNLGGPHGGAVDWACTNEHFWSVGSFIQVIQFDEWQDARGEPCERTNAVQQPTFTSAQIYLGGGRAYGFRVRMAAWQIGVCAFVTVAALFALLAVARKRFQRRQT